MKRLLTISLLSMALGCAGTGGVGPGDSGSGGLGPEGDDPGLRGGRSLSGAVEASAAGFQTVHFAFDDYSLGEEAKQGLRHNAQVLKENPSTSIEIQGNCDERGTEEYNLALGMRRAETAKRYLVDLGIDGDRLGTVSFGEENPAVRASNEAAWAKNRRADFARR